MCETTDEKLEESSEGGKAETEVCGKITKIVRAGEAEVPPKRDVLGQESLFCFHCSVTASDEDLQLSRVQIFWHLFVPGAIQTPGENLRLAG